MCLGRGLHHGLRRSLRGRDQRQVLFAGAAHRGRSGRQGRNDDGGSRRRRRRAPALLSGSRRADAVDAALPSSVAGSTSCSGEPESSNARPFRPRQPPPGSGRWMPAAIRRPPPPVRVARTMAGVPKSSVSTSTRWISAERLPSGRSRWSPALQRSSLLFDVVRGGRGVGHRESLSSLAVRPTVYKGARWKSGTQPAERQADAAGGGGQLPTPAKARACRIRAPRPPLNSSWTSELMTSCGVIQVSSRASWRGVHSPVTGMMYASATACWRSSVKPVWDGTGSTRPP